ncbi:SUR7 protein [Plectosphaerella cucumerina]|jgi:hypothetical protein|uniref:SUR7 protein n=1 Tax=Plectosphaerella cucumerina TaxID=40658 RepID=A0A8K0X665_9PEZI|nr:SUR7 protein [Plectosphaerella cucumerina]
MGVGRFICVALPFILSAASLVALLIACLGGVTNKDLYMFRVNATDMQISRSEIQGLIESVTNGDMPDFPNLGNLNDITRRADSTNVTAAQLGIDSVFDIALWGYCETESNGTRTCTKPEFDWAATHLNTSWITAVGELSGGAIKIPDELTKALETYQTVSKWTQVAYIIAFVSLALAVITGIFANCTRVMSCVTYIVATIAAAVVIAAAALSTVTSTVVVGSLEASAKMYGVRSNFNTTFLALVWASAAFALGAAFFWLFTICCCAPSHNSRKSRNRDSTDGEKLLPITGNKAAAYQPLGSPAHQGFYDAQSNNQYGAPRHASGGARADMAYEPYSHRS